MHLLEHVLAFLSLYSKFPFNLLVSLKLPLILRKFSGSLGYYEFIQEQCILGLPADSWTTQVYKSDILYITIGPWRSGLVVELTALQHTHIVSFSFTPTNH
jgi:hypothetical protein